MVNLLRIKFYLCCTLLLLTNYAAAAPAAIADRPVLDASSFELDGPSNLMVVTEVRISTQSGYVIKAGEARTTDIKDFNNSRWTFKNKVEITTPEGHSSADIAIVSFSNNQISTLHLAGEPATFEQRDAAKQIVAQGHANAIDYDLAQHTVRLSNNAWVSYGQNECHAVALVYNIAQQRVFANREEQHGERINCTISPAINTKSKNTVP